MTDPTGQIGRDRGLARKAIHAAYGPAALDDLGECREEYPIYDLITDLRHLADAHGLDWEHLLERASYHYRLDQAEYGDG